MKQLGLFNTNIWKHLFTRSEILIKLTLAGQCGFFTTHRANYHSLVPGTVDLTCLS